MIIGQRKTRMSEFENWLLIDNTWLALPESENGPMALFNSYCFELLISCSEALFEESGNMHFVACSSPGGIGRLL